jgi:hypothetical protein
MILRLELPFLDTAFPRGVVSHWSVEAGQQLDYGAVICEVTCSDRLKLRGTSLAAHKLMRMAKQSESPVEYRWRKGKVEVVYQIVSSESARLVAIHALEGADVSTGDLLAIVATGADPVPAEAPPKGSPTLRVAARSLEATQRSGL